jgi:BlaI family penicillinase repressor
MRRATSDAAFRRQGDWSLRFVVNKSPAAHTAAASNEWSTNLYLYVAIKETCRQRQKSQFYDVRIYEVVAVVRYLVMASVTTGEIDEPQPTSTWTESTSSRARFWVVRRSPGRANCGDVVSPSFCHPGILVSRFKNPIPHRIDDARRYVYDVADDTRRQLLTPKEGKEVVVPEGKLTPVQFEIMQLIWNSPEGLTIGEIWETIRGVREVSRTTVLNLVDRLEKRAWLTRRKEEGVFRYTAGIERQLAESQLAADFVEEFFAGSAANLVMSLLGSRRISASDIQRLKQIIDHNENRPTPKKRDSK